MLLAYITTKICVVVSFHIFFMFTFGIILVTQSGPILMLFTVTKMITFYNTMKNAGQIWNYLLKVYTALLGAILL